MERRMATKTELSCEFQTIFQAKNNQRKIANYTNQTYLTDLREIWNSLPINWNAFIE